MFEEELALEKKTSSVLPLLLLVALIILIVGVSLYFVMESKRVLTTAEASPVVQALLEGQPPAVLRFQTGVVDSEKVREPNYRLLEKQGYLKIGKDKKGETPVTLTPEGQAFLADIAGVKQAKKNDGKAEEYAVPLAQRRLVEINKITMDTPLRALVEYTWKWEPTKGGDLLDAAGPAIKEFSSWDRTTLIDKYGADFYHGAPTKVTIALVQRDKGWELGAQ